VTSTQCESNVPVAAACEALRSSVVDVPRALLGLLGDQDAPLIHSDTPRTSSEGSVG